jgi:hypothetical protein
MTPTALDRTGQGHRNTGKPPDRRNLWAYHPETAPNRSESGGSTGPDAPILHECRKFLRADRSVRAQNPCTTNPPQDHGDFSQ